MNVGKIEQVKRVFLYVKFDAKTRVHAPVHVLAGGEVNVCCGVFTCVCMSASDK